MDLVRTIFYIVVRLLSVIIAGLGFASTLTGDSVLTISPERGWVVGTVAFGVFFAVTVVREVDLRLQEKPSIVVVPEVSNECAKLVVTNNGGEGDFTAKARVRASMPEPGLYTMYWESVPDVSCHIDGGGGVASILVGRRAKSDHVDQIAMNEGDISSSFFRGDLVLFKRGASGVELFPACSSARWKESRDGKEVDVFTNIERCIVEVTITSTPKLKEKWEERKYLCETKDRRIKLCETDLSDPNVFERSK